MNISSVEYFRFDVPGVAAMAIDAFVGCVLVNHDRLVADELGLDVTFGASHVRMATREREMGASVVIER